jgi:hypothetical protein
MIKRVHTYSALVSLLVLTGCGGVDLVSPGKSADLGDGVTVMPTTAWARVHWGLGRDPLLTIDGIGLGELHYYTGVQPGSPIFAVSGVSNKEVGAYDPNMLPNDVMELLVANLTKAGNQNVRASNLSPAKFGSANGFRFDLAFVTSAGLNMRGETLISQRGGKLDLLLYIAPEEYYFAHRQPDVEQLFSTIQVAS